MRAMLLNTYITQLLTGDFVPVANALTFGPVATTGSVMCLNVSLVDNDLFESQETFTVILTSSSPFVTVTSAMNTSTVTVLDDEGNYGVLNTA